MTRKWKIILGVVTGLLLLGIWLGWRFSSQEPVVKTTEVQRRAVTQDVTFTGKLRSLERAQLAFETTGTLREVLVEVGDAVSPGQVLARLDTRQSTLEVAKARADQAAAAQQSQLGWQDTETTATRVATENARILDTSRQAVRNAKTEMDQAQEVWQQAVREAGDEASTTKARYSSFLAAQSAYRTTQQSLKQTEATTNKSNHAARSTADEAKAVYEATQQAARGVAGLSSSGATLALANLRLAKNVAVAPFEGVVTAKSVNAGELAVAGTPLITVESTDMLEVVADVPESDITKLTEGMKAIFTFDAFSDGRSVEATIFSIAPAAKVLEGVPTYEVVLRLATTPADLLSGMTTNVNVQTAHKESVLAIPRRAVTRVNGAYLVKVLQADGQVIERSVTLGIVGSDGQVEVLDGLKEGEAVVLPLEN